MFQNLCQGPGPGLVTPLVGTKLILLLTFATIVDIAS